MEDTCCGTGPAGAAVLSAGDDQWGAQSRQGALISSVDTGAHASGQVKDPAQVLLGPPVKRGLRRSDRAALEALSAKVASGSELTEEDRPLMQVTWVRQRCGNRAVLGSAGAWPGWQGGAGTWAAPLPCWRGPRWSAGPEP
jgi:hypothetical protein